MANQSIGTPRFYVDFTQLFKTKGFYFWEEGLQNVNKIDNNDAESNNNIWDFDLYRPQTYNAIEGKPDFYFYTNEDKNFSRLAGLANWAGFFNHDFASSFQSEKSLIIGGTFGGENQYRDLTDIYNCNNIDRNGFSIGTFGEFGEESVDRIYLGLRQSDTYPTDLVEPFSVACASFGRFYDISKSAELNLTKSIQYEGVKIQRTLGGGDYVQIDNFGTPDWISGEPWALVHPSESNSRVGKHGRRFWQLSFKHVSNDDLFFDINRLNTFGDLDHAQGSSDNPISAGSEIQQIFDLTMCGAFSFIFCPDKDSTDADGNPNPEFAQCRLDQNSLSATQVAYQTWDISMKIVEVW
tara:strand:- start:101 stop:1156 length:1056 start_codon:yes stop_codon:yes gene_type:complete